MTLAPCTLALALAFPAQNQGGAADPGAESAAVDEERIERIRHAAELAGLELTDEELALMADGVYANREGYRRARELELANDVAPTLGFASFVDALSSRHPLPALPSPLARALPEVERPADLEDLAFADIPTLASLIRSRSVSCLELTDMYLARLERLDPRLHCVITLTSDRARAQARRLDAELAEDEWRGPLHGIPWGAKDLLATRGVRTTWGAKPFEHQELDLDATVVRRLDEAGAVLVAKLSMGALAWGDVWFGETTRNPWDPRRGSSGSSAGPASATAAGCVAFSIGSETYGSIVSPSARCGCSSLRPTYGRVSRHGAMSLSWSMDKLGPICRSLGDAAVVMEAIQGPDARDDQLIARPFADLGRADVGELKVGYVAGSFGSEEREKEVLESVRALGVEVAAVELPDYPVHDMIIILNAEAAAAFDELTRSGRDDELVRQVRYAWPNAFREARLIPAVEYINANRVRRRLAEDWARLFDGIDVLVHPSDDGSVLAATNLTGHPTVVVPTELAENGLPGSLCFTGQYFDEPRLLAFGEAWQRSTGFHEVHPTFE